jgi:hypothetical protein
MQKFKKDLHRRVQKGELTIQQIIEAKEKAAEARLKKQKDAELKRQKLRELAIERYGKKLVEIEER